MGNLIRVPNVCKYESLRVSILSGSEQRGWLTVFSTRSCNVLNRESRHMLSWTARVPCVLQIQEVHNTRKYLLYRVLGKPPQPVYIPTHSYLELLNPRLPHMYNAFPCQQESQGCWFVMLRLFHHHKYHLTTNLITLICSKLHVDIP